MVSGGVEEKVEEKNEKEKKENIWPTGKEKEEIIGRGKIFGQRRKRRTRKEKRENILEKESDDGQTYKQNSLL